MPKTRTKQPPAPKPAPIDRRLVMLQDIVTDYQRTIAAQIEAGDEVVLFDGESVMSTLRGILANDDASEMDGPVGETRLRVVTSIMRQRRSVAVAVMSYRKRGVAPRG